MAHKMSFIAGLALGAGGALLARELMKRSPGESWHEEHWREWHLEPEDSRSESHVPNFSAVPDRARSGSPGATSSQTEAEMRRAMASENADPIRYTRDPRASSASGGTAPFIKKEEEKSA